MKKITMMCLLLFLSSFTLADTPAATREKLPVISEHDKKIMLSTQDIPEQATVLVDCKVNLPHSYKTQFSFLVYPQMGETGAIQAYMSITQSGPCYEGGCCFATTDFVRDIGSKIYTHRRSTSTLFHITQVKRNNEAIVFDLSKMPDGTTVNCAF